MFDIVTPTYREIIQSVEESSLARLFLHMEYGKKYRSLFREDPNPSAGLYYSKNGRLRYNDFIQNLSIPEAIMRLNNWDYNQFLKEVCDRFNIVPNNQISPNLKFKNKIDFANKYKKESLIQIKRRNFNNDDKNFWKKFGITIDTLKLYNVFSISHFWINGKLINGSKYCYSYDFYWEDNIFRRKIYQPYETDYKWFSNGGKICQGEINMPNSGDLLIVTKSLKDVMTLHELGYTAVAPPSESTFLPEQYFFKQKERFKRVVIWYDNDFDKKVNTGQLKAKEFSEKYEIENVFIPSKYEIKDISDYILKYGKNKSLKLIDNILCI